MVLGGIAVMDYTLGDVVNQYSYLGISLVVLVLASLLGRWWVLLK
jgi:hypothetical protein